MRKRLGRKKHSGNQPTSGWKKQLKKLWKFIWEEDSVLSWVVNVLIAFVLIKFLVYPGIGFLLGTSHPVVAVVSGSMEHKATHPVITDSDGTSRVIKSVWSICDNNVGKSESYNLDEYWKYCGEWYEANDITKDEFSEFKFKNGFNTGDIIVLTGSDPEDIDIGDVIVFQGRENYPIIHRVVDKRTEDGQLFFTTKGDHNGKLTVDDQVIPEGAVIGKASFRIPWLGWIKLGAFRILEALGILKLFGLSG